MGKDLYYIPTPKPEPEVKLYDLYHTTWAFLQFFFDKEELDDVEEIELTEKDISTLETIKKTVRYFNRDTKIALDIQDLIDAINKFDSVSLLIK